jgi:HSP20 family molecular chaperone IbpA
MADHDTFPDRSGASAEPDSLRALWPTIAEPITFAPPIDVKEDETSITLSFDVANRAEEDLEVIIEGQTLFVLGEALPRPSRGCPRARRAFALPAGVDASKARMTLASRVLDVTITKHGPRVIRPLDGGG